MEASKTLARGANLNIEASKVLAAKGHESTRKMEAITREMHIIAQKAKQESVSMRVNTLVTLFFLPGIFISVCRPSSLKIVADDYADTHEYRHIQRNKHRLVR